jgi:hypothetical protein
MLVFSVWQLSPNILWLAYHHYIVHLGAKPLQAHEHMQQPVVKILVYHLMRGWVAMYASPVTPHFVE